MSPENTPWRTDDQQASEWRDPKQPVPCKVAIQTPCPALSLPAVPLGSRLLPTSAVTVLDPLRDGRSCFFSYNHCRTLRKLGACCLWPLRIEAQKAWLWKACLDRRELEWLVDEWTGSWRVQRGCVSWEPCLRAPPGASWPWREDSLQLRSPTCRQCPGHPVRKAGLAGVCHPLRLEGLRLRVPPVARAMGGAVGRIGASITWGPCCWSWLRCPAQET